MTEENQHTPENDPHAANLGQTPEPATEAHGPLTFTHAEKKASAPLADSAALPARVWEKEFAETLSEARHELHLISHASKFEWINKRLILIRNAVIAFSVIVAVIIITALCYHEAYQQTLTISAFEVPEKLAEHGITGQAVAKALFDELIKRRKTVTTIDAGDLKSAWTESHSDVTVPETGFTMQSVFHYLRSLTGKEIAIDGEMLVEGDEITIKARVAGNPPHSVKGKLAEWEALLDELANYVYETTQPVVLASYLGLTAKTPQELEALSRLVLRMGQEDLIATPASLSVAHYAYGLALMRQNKTDAALTAWERARALDPKFALPYFAAAGVLVNTDPALAAKLYNEAESLNVSDQARLGVSRNRIRLAISASDCKAYRQALDEMKRLNSDRLFDPTYSVICEYKQAEGVKQIRKMAALHPDDTTGWAGLALAEDTRVLKASHLKDAIEAEAAWVKADRDGRDLFARPSYAMVLARAGQYEAALAAYQAGLELTHGADTLVSLSALATLHFVKGEFKKAEAVMQHLPRSLTSRTDGLFAAISESQGRTDEAIAVLRDGYQRNPLYCPDYDMAAGILLKHGRDAEAFAEWEKGIAAIPRCDFTYVHMAQALIERKRIAEAKQKLELLLKNSPESDGAEIAKEMLANMAKAG